MASILGGGLRFRGVKYDEFELFNCVPFQGLTDPDPVKAPFAHLFQALTVLKNARAGAGRR